MNKIDIIIEAALLASAKPLTVRDLHELFEPKISSAQLNQVLLDLQRHWSSRGLRLTEVAGGWRFQTHEDMSEYIDRLHEDKPAKYSRAVLETLAIVAYRQPVTRGDIEEIRGVTVNAQIIRQLEDRGWIESVGYRDVPGRPTLFATTRQFLQDLGLRRLSDLPPLPDFERAVDFELTQSATESDSAAP